MGITDAESRLHLLHHRTHLEIVHYKNHIHLFGYSGISCSNLRKFYILAILLFLVKLVLLTVYSDAEYLLVSSHPISCFSALRKRF